MKESPQEHENIMQSMRIHELNNFRNESQDDRDYRFISIRDDLTYKSDKHRSHELHFFSGPIIGEYSGNFIKY